MYLVTSLFRWERSVSPRENKWCVTWIYFGVVHIEERIWDKWCVYDVESRGLKILYCSSHYSHCFHEHGVRLVNSKHKCIFDFSKFLFRYVSSFNLQFSPTEIGWKFPFFSSLNKTGNLGQKLKAKKTRFYRKSRTYISQMIDPAVIVYISQFQINLSTRHSRLELPIYISGNVKPEGNSTYIMPVLR